MSPAPKRSASPIGDPLTAEQVRELLWKAEVLSESERLPAEAELLLAKRLNGDQGQYVIDQLLNPVNAAKRKAAELITEARNELATVAEEERKLLAAAEDAAAANPKHIVFEVSAGAKRDHLHEIAAIDHLLSTVLASLVLSERRNTTAGKWQENGLYWVDALNEALATIGKRVALSNKGPAGRFMAALVPRLTGERTTTESAAQQLQLLRRQARQG